MDYRPKITMRLSADSAKQLAHMVRTTGRTRNELLQAAIDRTIADHRDGGTNLQRIAQTVEFIQIALDHVHKKDIEPVRDGIMLNVAKRMEQFHGAR